MFPLDAKSEGTHAPSRVLGDGVMWNIVVHSNANEDSFGAPNAVFQYLNIFGLTFIDAEVT